MQLKLPFQRMILSDGWFTWHPYSGLEAKHLIESSISSGVFWRDATLLVQVSLPIINLLRMVDSGKPTVGKFFEHMNQLIEHVRGLQDMDGLQPGMKEEIEDILQERWRFMHSPMHAAGFVLDPQWKGKGQEKDVEAMEGFRIIRNKFYPDVRDQATVEKQLALYRSSQGLFADPAATLVAKEIPAHAWWSSYGAGTPELQALATRILSQVTVASACERNWSQFYFIHSKRRNRLTNERASDLVYVFSTLRLKKKVFDPDYEEPFIEWKDSDDEIEEIEEFQ